ncbi:unnamed protein product [Peniophora sp. CBMAI 1063]|nr:unnamed protein product [Peniophora sp. CBMAI 1063]
MSGPSQQIHLAVFIHGMWGYPAHLNEAKRIMTEAHVEPSKDNKDGVQVRILVSDANAQENTYDGIDWGGERVAQEILDEVEKIADEGGKVTRISVMGYSLGGLIARYVIGILHQKGFFETVQPVNFTTFASPNLGLLHYPTLFSRLAHKFGPYLLSRTGEQFYAVDKWSKRGRPLVEVMADPERVFYQALALFPHIQFYANAMNDLTVPFCTAAVELHDPFMNHKKTGIDVVFQEGYEPIVKSWSIPAEPPAPAPKPKLFSKAWVKRFNNSLPIPPRLQFGFPGNIIMALLLPILIPSFIGFAIARLALSAKWSRARLRLLEKTDAPRLLSIVAELEREIEGFVNDATEIANQPSTPPTPSGTSDYPHPGPTDTEAHILVNDQGKLPGAPDFSPAQLRAHKHLNALPQLKKELVWIPEIRNTHAAVVARDVKNFPFHKIGQGVLRHWADSFIV